jgi:DNA processing protein
MGDTKKYWIGFSRIKGIGAIRLQSLLQAFGDIETAWNAPSAALRVAGLGSKTIQSLIKGREQVDLDYEVARIEEEGFHILTWEDDEYPIRLREIGTAPPVIYIWGEFKPSDRWSVAVVGTRRATYYGQAVTRDLVGALAANGVTVISGLARGIDAIAHQTALESGGRTIAVLGSGLDNIYPPEHRRLAESISKQGALISDYPLGTKPEGRNFPPRNRLISGLALAVVVVEAPEGSGALITADFAAEQGREVFAVPGSIYNRASRGTIRLIKAGANPMLSPEDVLEALNMELVVRQDEVVESLPENKTERRILEALCAEPIHVDELQFRCGVPAAEISATLALLELKGRARQVGGMCYIRVREKKANYSVE